MTQNDQHAMLLAEAFAAFNQTSTQLETAYHELEDQVVELSRELDSRKRLAAVGEVAATLAHQLRTPLASALLYLGPLEKGTLEGEAAARQASKALARLKQIETMINDMLTYTRGGRGGSESFSAGDLLESVAQVLEPQLETATLGIQDTSGNVALRGNREALTGSLLNLANNAIEAAGPGARVVIIARRDADALEIEVSDNGPGIAATVRDRLFEPFVTGRSNGTGLGLAVVRGVIDAHGGSIRANSTDAGAVFVLRLPLANADVALASGAGRGIAEHVREIGL